MFYISFYAHAEISRISKERATPQTDGLFMIWRVSKMPYEVLLLFDFSNIESTCMHQLLMKMTEMRLKSDFFGRSVCIVVYGK